MKRRKVWLLPITPLILLMLLLMGIAAPDSGPFITRVDIYRHCIEDDDMLVIGRYNWPYASSPNETATSAVVARFMDGSTELTRVSPYSYYDSGWQTGGFSMYLAADEAPTWEGSYSVVMEGSPTLSWTPSTPIITTSSITWRGTTNHSATAALLYAHLKAYAQDLSDDWSVALLSSTAQGEVLSDYGVAYFTNMIPQLRSMAPALFSAGSEATEYTDTEWTLDTANATKESFPLNFKGASGWLGFSNTSDDWLRIITAFGLIFFVMSIAVKAGRGDVGLFIAFGMMMLFAWTGWISPIIAVGAAFAVILMVLLVGVWGKVSS